MPTKADLGKRIRGERVRQNLTLKDVEKRSGVSATHISQIERGITWPTVKALGMIAGALEKQSSFFLEDVELPEVCLLSGDGKKAILSERPRLVLSPLTTGIPGGKLHFYTMLADPADGHEGFPYVHQHEGDECGRVLSGRIEVKIGDDAFQLKAGDAIHFKGTLEHGIRNIGDGPSESIWACWKLGM
jgi:transcriptional regulator with XRE-family HTH domain